MIRGSTPTHIFKLPCKADTLNKIRILYAQDDNILFTKKTEDCDRSDYSVSVKLTQEETFMFDCNKFVQIQIRAATVRGDVIQSKIKTVTVGKCLDCEVL